MGDSSESNCLKDEADEKDLKISPGSKITEIHPLAFTIEFDDQKFDESKKSKVQERLSAFTLKHRRNPSLPDFREVKNTKSSTEKVISPVNSQHVPILHKRLEKSGKSLDSQWKSTALKAAKQFELQGPFSFKENSGFKENFIKNLKIGRRFSLDGIEDSKATLKNVKRTNAKDNYIENISANKNDDGENKSDTVSEAGTYTVDKDNEDSENDANRTQVLRENEAQNDSEYINESKKNYHSSWINDWVRDVEQQNLRNPRSNEPPPIVSRNLENANGSCGGSKIPSPLNTLTRKAKPRSIKPGDGNKMNGSACHRRSSSLNAKDYNENHGSESSLETESFLKTTESVMTSMQNRMKFALEKRSPDFKRMQKRNFTYQERPHPPSTASDTDTNSESDAKTFKKPIGNPFTSARLNRAFSLRRAKADPEKDSAKAKSVTNANEGIVNAKQLPTAKVAASKPPSSTPFSRLDCGRFSMRSTVSGIRSNFANQVQKKEVKKSNGGNRSISSLSSREVEFQNWRRRKSFDPMKAAAEGRKKELAKKAAMNHSLTLSVNLGSGARGRSSGGNPVLRSASFHSTAQVLGGDDDEGEGFQEQGSTDEQEESASSSYLSSRHSRPLNSPSNVCGQCKPIPLRTAVFSSRSSLVSETHSSPSRRLKSNDLENLVLSAISETSFKLKLKSCRLLKKLNYLYEPGEEKSFRIRDELELLENNTNSAKNSPVHQAVSRDLSSILKNLKRVENVFNVLEDVLFDENLEIYVSE